MRLGSTCDSAGLFMCLQASVYAKPMAAQAHQPAQKMPVVGFLNGGSAGPFAQYVAASPRTVSQNLVARFRGNRSPASKNGRSAAGKKY